MRVRHLIAVATAVFGLLAVFAGGALAQTETIASVSPSSGPVAGGTTVVITGDYIFDAMPRPVTIGGANATFVSQEIVNQGPTAKITVTTPPGTAGPADVVIYAYAGGPELVRKTGGFTYTELSVKSVTPTSGLTTGEEPITITGTGFSGGATPTVTIGGTPATSVTVINDTTITATTPAHAKGTVDVMVSLDGRQATASGAYTFNQGYWLTVTAKRPAAIGYLDSPGAIRTPAFGTWATTTTETLGGDAPGKKPLTTTIHSSYSGGMNCGDRGVTIAISDGGADAVSTERWAGGSCRYAFPENAQAMTLQDLPAAYSLSYGLLVHLVSEQTFLAGWGGDCTPTLLAGCTVRMTADRNVRATWGFFRFSLSGGSANVVYPTFSADGSVSFIDASLSLKTAPVAVGGTPGWTLVAQIPVASAAENGTGTRTRQVVVCRAKARLSGRRLTARCTPTQALSRALRKGSVRMTTRWYVRLPNQRAAQLMASRAQLVHGRRGGAVTG